MRSLLQLFGAALRVAVEGDGAAVTWVWCKRAHLWLHKSNAPRKSEVARDARTESTNGVREHRRLHAVNVCGERHAAKFATRLKEDRLDPRARQVCGCNESVMSAAEDDHIGAVARAWCLCRRRLLLLGGH